MPIEMSENAVSNRSAEVYSFGEFKLGCHINPLLLALCEELEDCWVIPAGPAGGPDEWWIYCIGDEMTARTQNLVYGFLSAWEARYRQETKLANERIGHGIVS